MTCRLLVCLATLLGSGTAMAVDLTPLWDFSDPALSEQRFRDALATAEGDDALILRTQIARTYGMRGEFETARRLLTEIEPMVRTAGAEARVRHALEWGRTYASATSPPDLPPEDRERARSAYTRAREIAREAGLDGLAVDAVHMMAFVDTAAADQIRWAREALAIVEASEQPEAKRWEASLRNNLGYALHQSGDHDTALREFEQALTLREQAGDAGSIRVARWMIAWTLRALGRADEALEIQLGLEEECRAAGEPDPYVFEELEILYRDRGDTTRAEKYAALRKATAP